MKIRKLSVAVVLPGVSVLILACCSTLPLGSSCGHGSGAVLDEALCVGRTADSFPAADEDYFRDMDYGVTKTPKRSRGGARSVPARHLARGRDIAAVKGRNNWIVWTGGNDRLWDVLSVDSAGILDFLKILSSHPEPQALKPRQSLALSRSSSTSLASKRRPGRGKIGTGCGSTCVAPIVRQTRSRTRRNIRASRSARAARTCRWARTTATPPASSVCGCFRTRLSTRRRRNDGIQSLLHGSRATTTTRTW